MAEHSMCHPGRPLPQGDAHETSPSLDFFHKAKSLGDFFSPVADSSPAAGIIGVVMIAEEALTINADLRHPLKGLNHEQLQVPIEDNCYLGWHILEH